MNFNYSYKAFLISSLLVGGLFLFLILAKLGKQLPPEVETVPVEYADILPEEEELAVAVPVKNVKIETNKAYNEAEKFIEAIENSRQENLEEETLIAETESKNYNASGNTIDFKKAENKLNEVKAKLVKADRKKNNPSNDISRKTTISYSLKDRNAIYLPNPVYTCDASGKIVITIEVNELGKIVKKEYNPTLSTTTNGCLIDAALAYAEETRFNTEGSKPKQLGTISYHFPGQN
ncbi:MAG: hypothetical protein R2781_06600 [Flavobacteriaceae bacterium]